MPVWSVAYDYTTASHVHRIPAGRGHALLVPLAADVFRNLRVSAFLRDDTERWWRLHSEPSLNDFDVEHGAQHQRQAYNLRCFAEVAREHRVLIGENAGTTDAFAPVVIDGKVAATLVTGPFVQKRPTSDEILDHWRTLTGREGDPADAEFAAFFTAKLDALVLDGGKLQTFRELLERLTELLAGRGDAGALLTRIDALRAELESCRRAERSWSAARQMLDDRSQRSWVSADRRWGLSELGLTRVPDHALVGLTTNLSGESNPVDERVRRDLLQRWAVDHGRKLGGVVAGRVGDHGVVYLFAPRRRDGAGILEGLIERTASHARRKLGLRVWFGSGRPQRSQTLSRCYLGALAAADAALTQRKPWIDAPAAERTPLESLRRLREGLSGSLADDPTAAGSRFDRYVEAVLAESGHRFDALRGHLDTAFELMAAPIVRRGTLDRKGYRAICDELDRAAEHASTPEELTFAYRSAVTSLVSAVRQPVPSRRDRNLRVALDFVHQHYTEALDFRAVARLAGFAPNYFSGLFKAREGVTFERYVLELRIDRARTLLTASDSEVARIAEASGFNSVQYFCRVFRQIVGGTPLEYRRQPGRYSRRKRRPQAGNKV